VIADKGPDVASFAKVSLNFQRPTFERGLAFPEKLVVTMNKLAGAVVLGRIIAEQSQIKEIGRARQKFVEAHDAAASEKLQTVSGHLPAAN